MQLKRVVLTGFKSFPRKTVLDFGPSLNVIVGPNGAGKSNIIDAIKWALGSGSIKDLRGNRMEDMIFSGTENKPPMNMAEVQLVFENNGLIPLDYDVIEIKRRFFRDGTGEFFINNTPCRLKDILENFANTGILYSILDNGSITKLIISDQVRRRELFESVANIGKYREDRKEAYQKLSKTEAELEKLGAILQEKEKFARSLRRQAAKARAFRRTVEELKEKKFLMGCYNLYNLNTKLMKLSEEIENISLKLKEKEEKKNGLLEKRDFLQDSIKERKTLLEGLRKEEQDYRRRFLDAKSEFSRISGVIERLNKSLSEFGHVKITEKDEIETLISSYEDKLNNLKEEIHLVFKELRKLEEKRNELDAEIRSDELELARIHERLKGISLRKEEEREKLDHLIEKRGKLLENLPELQKNIQNIDKELYMNAEEINELTREIEKLQRIRSGVLRTKEELDRKRMRLEEELNVLKNTSIDTGDVPEEMLERFQLENISKGLKVKKGYEKIVENALSNLLYVLSGKDESIADAIKYAKAHKIGEIGFFFNSLKTRKGKKNLAEVIVQDPSGFASEVLSRFKLVDSIEDAIEAYKKENGFYVTKDGETLIFGAVILHGERLGPVMRQSKIENLQEEIQKLLETVRDKEQEIQELNRNIESLSGKRRNLEKEREELSRRKSEMEMEISRQKYRVEEVESGINRTKTLIKELEKEKESLSLREKELMDSVEETRTRISEVETRMEVLSEDAENLKEEISQIEKEYRDLKSKLEGIEQVEKLENERSILIKRSEELRKETDELSSKLDTITEKINSIEVNIESLNTEFSDVIRELEALENEILDFNLQKKELETKKEEIEREKEIIIKNTMRETERTPVPKEPENLSALEEEIIKLTKKKERLSEVNLLAVEEYEKIKGELDELIQQKQDLLKAKADILEVIRSIDERAERQFVQTVNEIRKHFQRIFTRFFGGGSADIRLVGTEPLNADINIYARPPGKKMREMELLSDVEKTLTAISLLIGVTLAKNVGLLILDEIDAPLDEKNVERFLEVIREETGNCQIILITHNRRTMEEADYIYGVTMEEKGVSKVLSMSKEMLA